MTGPKKKGQVNPIRKDLDGLLQTGMQRGKMGHERNLRQPPRDYGVALGGTASPSRSCEFTLGVTKGVCNVRPDRFRLCITAWRILEK